MEKTNTEENKFLNSVIYKIVCKDEMVTEIYVGSTYRYAGRQSAHKSNCYNINKKGYNFKLYHYIRLNQGFDNFRLEMVESYPCEYKTELHVRERYLTNLLGAKLNFEVVGRTKSEYRMKEYKANFAAAAAEKNEKMMFT